jgi:hypothetical protein
MIFYLNSFKIKEQRCFDFEIFQNIRIEGFSFSKLLKKSKPEVIEKNQITTQHSQYIVFDTTLVLMDSRPLNTTMFENFPKQFEFTKNLKVVITNVG